MGTPLDDLSKGLGGFVRAPGFALRHGMGWMFLVPVVLMLAFAAGSFALGTWLVDQLGALAEGYLAIEVPEGDRSGWSGFLDDLKGFVNGTRELLLLLVVKLALWYFFSLFGKYVVLILLSPLLAYASERTEEIITGRSYPFRLGLLLKDTARGIVMALRNAALETGINLVAWAATLLFAPLAPVTLVLMALVSCWFYGFSMFDYIFERQRLGIGAGLRAARARRGLVMSNGALFWALMCIPFVGWIFAPLLAAIGAVIAWYGTGTGHRAAA